MSAALLIARKEAGELVLSARGLAWLLAVTSALSVFGLLLVGTTELSLLDNAQVVYDMVAIATALGALLALIAGIDFMAGEQERGTMVPLLLTPTSPGAILSGKLGGIAFAWAVIYILALPYIWAVGSTGQNLWQGMLVLVPLGTPIVLGFGFFGMTLGARLASVRAGLTTGLVTLAVSASPLVIGASLRQSVIGRIFDTVNPLSAAVNAYDAVIIDSETIFAQWDHIAVAAVWFVLTLWLARAGFRHITLRRRSA
jgi:ABC-type transport system involved in multi-copper enzyme maturation permease subunit